MSDTTASAPGSDDEVGSNAATDGSTLRTSPAEQAGSAGSESGGSVVDSVSSKQFFGVKRVDILMVVALRNNTCRLLS